MCSTGSSTPCVSPTSMAGSSDSPSLKSSATSSDSQRERSSVHTNVSDTAAATRWSSHSVIWSQIGPGSPSSMEFSASRCTLRSRSRRSCSMSAMRSAMPSVRVTCQRAERPRNSSARAFASSSWAIMRGVSSGCSIALSSERSDIGELLGDRDEIVHGAALVDHLGAPEHLAPQVGDERGESRLVVERAVLQLGGQQPQVARDGEHRHVAGIAAGDRDRCCSICRHSG